MEVRVAGSVVDPELNRLIGNFVSQRLWGAPGKIEKFSSLGVFDGGTLIAGVLWHNVDLTTGVAEISGAATNRRWLTREALRTMFDVPFNRWGCQLVVMRVSLNNEGVATMLRRFGFDEYRVPRLRGRTEDELILTLTDDTWRARQKKEHGIGQKFTSRAA